MVLGLAEAGCSLVFWREKEILRVLKKKKKQLKGNKRQEEKKKAMKRN